MGVGGHRPRLRKRPLRKGDQIFVRRMRVHLHTKICRAGSSAAFLIGPPACRIHRRRIASKSHRAPIDSYGQR